MPGHRGFSCGSNCGKESRDALSGSHKQLSRGRVESSRLDRSEPDRLLEKTGARMRRARSGFFRSEYSDNNQSQIIMLMRAAREFLDLIECGFNQCRGAQMMIFEQKIQDARLSVFDPLWKWCMCFDQTVGVKEDHISLLKM